MTQHLDQNINQYVQLMEKRALGILPEMGSARRFSQLIRSNCLVDLKPLSIIDMGCATGHYLRTFINDDIPLLRYSGIDIDCNMIDAAQRVWDQSRNNSFSINFYQLDIENSSIPADIPKHDISICSNAFMYFKSPMKALENIVSMTSQFIIIRSYFMDVSYRIVRSQTNQIHDKSLITEAESFTDAGDVISFDYWSIYSFKYIESVVLRLMPSAQISWLDDNNDLSTITDECNLGVEKRGATTIYRNQEIVYPFFLPWKFLLISL